MLPYFFLALYHFFSHIISIFAFFSFLLLYVSLALILYLFLSFDPTLERSSNKTPNKDICKKGSLAKKCSSKNLFTKNKYWPSSIFAKMSLYTNKLSVWLCFLFWLKICYFLHQFSNTLKFLSPKVLITIPPPLQNLSNHTLAFLKSGKPMF